MLINIDESLEKQPGSYVIVLTATDKKPLRIGKLGLFALLPGQYFYVGSAHGPGGIRSRVKHHLKISSKPHWHLDYLRPYCTVSAVWYSYSGDTLEHRWADALAALESLSRPMNGFGSSDCQCPSHLLYTESPLSFFDPFYEAVLAQNPASSTIEQITP